MVWERLCFPEDRSIKESILREAHESAYSIHPGSTKMYLDLKEKYWWYGLKRDVLSMSLYVILARESKQSIRDKQDCCNQ